MKIPFLIAFVGLAIIFALPTFAQQRESTDSQIAQQLEAIGRKSDEAWVKGNAAEIAAFFTENAVVVTPQGPVFGRQAIERMYTELFQKMQFISHVTKADENSPPITGPDGNEVWWFGAWSVTVQSQSNPPQQSKGYWSAVHIREGGAWKICMLTYNEAPHPISAASQSNTPDPKLRQLVLDLAKNFEEAWNNNDASALASLFTQDAVLVNDSGPVNGREAIKNYYTDLFKNVHFSNNVTTYDPNSPHPIGTDGKEMWENGTWSMTWQVKGGEPVQGKGYHASVAVLEGGALKKRLLIANASPATAATPSPTAH